MKNLKFSFFFLFFFCSNQSLSDSILINSSSFSNLLLDLAVSKDEKSVGLMFTKTLHKTNGMFFLYKIPKIVNFWMKNTYIPLDIIFVNNKQKVISINKGIPLSEQYISSIEPIKAVIEIPSGCSKIIDLKVGEFIDWKIINDEEKKDIRYYHCLHDY